MLSELQSDALKTDLTVPGDQELLRDYAANQSEGAFTELTRRHVDWVYSAALRQVGNHAAAQDVTQAVFIILARKAASLKHQTVLAGWLFNTVRYAARDAIKIEVRRRRREQEAVMMESDQSVPDPEIAWEQLAPCLDEALANLGVKDRQAVLLRFFEKKAWREVGESLGTNENAARVRVTRALEKLRALLQRRGETVPALVLSELLLGHAVQAAPAGLTVPITGSAASVSVIALVRAAWQRWLWRRTTGIASVLLLVGGTSLILRQQLLAERAVIARESHATVVALDRAFWLNEPDRFAQLVHFRTAKEEPLKLVFMAYLRAAAAFRKSMDAKFPDLSVQNRSFRATLDELLAGQPQPGVGPTLLKATRATDDSFRSQTVVLTNVAGVWKWDWMEALSPEVRRERLTALQHKTDLLDNLARQIREGTLTNAATAFGLFGDSSTQR